jgi:hypothetical protein
MQGSGISKGTQGVVWCDAQWGQWSRAVSGDELRQLARSFWLATASHGCGDAGLGGGSVARPWRCGGSRPEVLREHRAGSIAGSCMRFILMPATTREVEVRESWSRRAIFGSHSVVCLELL